MFRVLTARRARTSLVLAALAGLATRAPGVEEKPSLTVIVSAESDVKAVPRPDLARIYLGKKTLWESGARIQPAMLGENDPVVREFIEKQIGRTVDQYRAYWKQMLFSGGGTAPRTFRSTSQLVDFVAREPGAVGIVAALPTDGRVRVVEVKGD
jgi:hypothetical protein